MRSFSKKLAFALAAAMVLTAVAPAAQAKAADDFTLNRTAQTLYVNEGVNDKGVVEGLTGNVQSYDFNLKNKPADWKDYGYKWSSSNEKVATVVSGGITTAVGVGEATISCVITDATGNVVDTLKAVVTVKANAADVVISNADLWDGAAVEVGEEVDLNRTMFDENGNKTSKRGTYVTDLTKWVAEPSTGVTIDQATGKFTFTEAAAAGEYKLYCYTYQSAKYAQATATSDVVTVELVKESTFDVDQKSTTKLTLNFDSKVSKLAVADVTVTRLLELSSKTYEYPIVVKSVTLAKDGMSADVEVFTKFIDDTKYTIAVTGFEAVEKVMSVGKPASMTLAAKNSDPYYVLTTGTATELVATFYDEEGVEVTDDSAQVIYKLETRSTDGSYYLAGKNLTIKKEGVVVNVIAEYQGWIDENGKRVGKFDASQEFIAMDKTQTAVAGVSLATVSGYTDWRASTTMRKSATNPLQVVLLKTDGEKTAALKHNETVLIDGTTYRVTMTAINPGVAVVTSTGALVAFKTGVASFYVNLESYVNNKWTDPTPIYVVDVTVEEDAKFSYITLDTDAITVGTAAGFNTGAVKVTAYDTYNTQINFDSTEANKINIKCLSDGFEEDVFDSVFTTTVSNNLAVLTIDAAAAVELFPADLKPESGEAAVLYFSATYTKDSKESVVEFSVMIQVPETEDNAYVGNYIQIETSATSIDAARYVTAGAYNNNDYNDNTEKVKSVSFQVFEMNNGVKVDTLDFTAYPTDGKATSVSSNAYVYKLTKDGENFKGAVNESALAQGKISVDLSTTKTVSNGGLTAQLVDYTNVGAGTYEFALYKCYGEGDDRVLVQEYSSVVAVYVSDKGAYSVAGSKVDNEVEVSATYNAADAEELLKCFVIQDRKGNLVVEDGEVKTAAKYYVNYSAPENSGYVYVKEIVFYEECKLNWDYSTATGVYVDYVVTIDEVLTNTAK